MGRKTYESIGKPLPERINIILTHDPHYKAPGCEITNSPEAAIRAAGNPLEVMVIGGAEVYRQFLPKAKRMYLTLIDEDFEGDAYFPEFNPSEWQETERRDFAPDSENPYHYRFLTLERKS